MAHSFEINFDGLVGSTHNYSGLSHGNLASTSNQANVSNPLEAVLQGLEKMKKLHDDGFKQAVLPPQERPSIETLRSLGFDGTEKKILEQVAKNAPELLSAVSSASSMWTANAATVSPSSDTSDRKVHFTPANLVSKFHRSIEIQTTTALLKKIFKDQKYFSHHQALPAVPALGDEGAANHTRLCADYSKKGVEFFVYGRNGIHSSGVEPKVYPARQTLEASQALARSHHLSGDAVVFGQQNPAAIDGGVFHNDVAGVGNQNFYLYHEEAYVNSKMIMGELKNKFKNICGSDLLIEEVPSSLVSLSDAVKSYLFNSQLLTVAPGHMALVAPTECAETSAVAKYLEKLLMGNNPIKEIRYFNLRQSMRNGGGPACLRLRVVLNEKELAAMNRKVLMTDKLYKTLVVWAKKHYRDRLESKDLADFALLKECRQSLDELTQILGLGSIYSFQKN